MAFVRSPGSTTLRPRSEPRPQVDAVRGMRLLHAGLAVALVVDHHDGEIRRLLHADGGEQAQAHQHLAVAGDHQHAALRLREREAQAPSSPPGPSRPTSGS